MCIRFWRCESLERVIVQSAPLRVSDSAPAAVGVDVVHRERHGLARTAEVPQEPKKVDVDHSRAVETSHLASHYRETGGLARTLQVTVTFPPLATPSLETRVAGSQTGRSVLNKRHNASTLLVITVLAHALGQQELTLYLEVHLIAPAGAMRVARCARVVARMLATDPLDHQTPSALDQAAAFVGNDLDSLRDETLLIHPVMHATCMALLPRCGTVLIE